MAHVQGARTERTYNAHVQRARTERSYNAHVQGARAGCTCKGCQPEGAMDPSGKAERACGL